MRIQAPVFPSSFYQACRIPCSNRYQCMNLALSRPCDNRINSRFHVKDRQVARISSTAVSRFPLANFSSKLKPESPAQKDTEQRSRDDSQNAGQQGSGFTNPNKSSSTNDQERIARLKKVLAEMETGKTGLNSGNASNKLDQNSPISTSPSRIFSSPKGGNTSTSFNPRAIILPHGPPPTHHLHIYATKHNTHLCLANPKGAPIIKLSCGQLQFRKAARGSYDAAHQLAIYLLAQIRNRGLYNTGCDPKLGPIQALEIVYRDFGQGREAVSKVLLSAEGTQLRDRTIRITDSTRIKFGGTRSPRPRRLG